MDYRPASLIERYLHVGKRRKRARITFFEAVLMFGIVLCSN